MAVFSVTNLNDAGAGSLRQAIEHANTLAGADVIAFSVSGTITLTSGQLFVTDDMILNGDVNSDGSADIIIDGNNADRVLVIDSGDTVTLSHLTVTGGAGFQIGGGILNNGDLTLDHVTLTGNTVTGLGPTEFFMGGGGIYNGDGSRLHLVDSTVSDNATVAQAGAGIYSFFNTETLIERSTISGNVAGDVGGGLRSLGNVDVVNSTFSGNTSTVWHGGGIFHTDGVLNVRNATFTDNSSPSATANSIFAGSFGGGVATANLVNSVFQEADLTVFKGEFGGSVIINAGANNLFSDANANAGLSDLTSTNALLGPLANNGGPTLTHTLLDGSPAIDAGDASFPVSGDQRGAIRDTPFRDIGAYEIAPLLEISQSLVRLENADGSLDADGIADLGDVIVYSLTIRNTGDLTASGVAITSAVAGPIDTSFFSAILNPGDGARTQYSYEVTAEDLVSGGASADGGPVDGSIDNLLAATANATAPASSNSVAVALTSSLGPPPPGLATVAVDFDGRGLFGSGFVESVADGIVDSGRLPIALNTAFFDDVDVAVDAAAPGFELLTFFGGSLGVYSVGDRFFRGEATLVNDSETLIFDMEEGAFGDALVAMFEFATVFGNGDVEVTFFDDGTFLGNETFNAYSGPVSADFDGQRFDAVEISAVGDTAFSLSSFAFDREMVSLSATITEIDENTDTTSRIKVADIVVTDDALGTNTLSLSGTDAALFEIDGLELFIKAGTDLDFETNPVLDVTVAVDDASIGGTPDGTASLVIPIVNVNEGPVIITDASGLTIRENTTAVIDLEAEDPDGDVLTYSISGGADAALFAVDLITGALSFISAPDFETPLDQGPDNIYDVTVQVSDGTKSDALNIAVEVLDVEPLTYTATATVVPDQLSFVGDGLTNDWWINIFTNDFGFSANADDLSLFRNYSIALSGDGTGIDQNFSLILDGNDMQTAAAFDFSAIGGTSRVDSSLILNTAANSEPVTVLGLLLNERVGYDIDTGFGNDDFGLALGESLDYTQPDSTLNINADGGSDTLNLDLNGYNLLLETTAFGGTANLDNIEHLVVTGAAESRFGGAVFRIDATTEFSKLDFSTMSSDEAEVRLGAVNSLLPSTDGVAIVTQDTGNDMLIDVGSATGSGPLGDFTIDSQDDDDEIRIDANGTADHIVTILNFESDVDAGSDDIVLNAAGVSEALNAIDVTQVGQANTLSVVNRTGDSIDTILNLTGLAVSTVGGIGGGGDLSDTTDGGAVERAIVEALLTSDGTALEGGDDQFYVVLDNSTDEGVGDTAIYRMSVESASGEVNSTANITDVTQIVRLVGVTEINNTDFDLEYTL